MNRQGHRSRSGVTLVEMLIALVLIAIAFGVLATTQVQNLQITSRSREASDATEFANRRVEQAVNQLLTPDAFSNAVNAGTVTTPIDEGRYAGSLTVGPRGTTYLEAGLLTVAVTMTEPEEVTFSRIVSCLDVVPPPSIAVPAPCPS